MSDLDRLALLQRQGDELLARVENAADKTAEDKAWKELEEWQARFDPELTELLYRVDAAYGL